MRVLLVEDDRIIGEGVKSALDREGYHVDWILDGAEALDAIHRSEFGLVILDLSLPSVDGLDILATIRKKQNPVPVLILTARDKVDDKVRGLDIGADDYLVKPFELAELKARARALSRRPAGQLESRFTFQRLTIDTAAYTMELDGKPVELSRREFALLTKLVSRPGRIFSKENLQDALYGWDMAVESNSIEVHIHHLRKKIYPELIETVRGIGYKVGKE